MVMTDPFGTSGEVDSLFAQEKVFGHAYRGRYHMPLLPGEKGTKAGGNYVPRGMMRATNLVGAFSESRALGVWEQEQMLVGLAKSPSLYEKLTILVHRAQQDGVDFLALRNHPTVRKALTGNPNDSASIDASIAGQAKQAAGANEARERGNTRHDAWEHRAKTGELIGTDDIRTQVVAIEAALDAAGLERVPDLSERVVRNSIVNCAGRFDDVVRLRRTGELFMADLKTKQRPFWTWLEVDMQLAIYAHSEWMLREDRRGYIEGPWHYVSLYVGAVLHMPSNGAPPSIRPANLTRGWDNARLARKITDERAFGKSVERETMGAPWQ